MMTHPDDGLRSARQCLRRLILPIPFAGEDKAAKAMVGAIASVGVEITDLPEFLDLRLREWQEQGKPAGDFAGVVGQTLGSVAQARAEKIGSCYFELHRIALEDPAGLSHLQGRQLLAHLPLMVMLCEEERMSAAQIACVLGARDSGVTCSWQAIQRILKKLGVYRELNFVFFQQLFEADVEAESAFFADGTVEDCLRTIADSGRKLGLGSDAIESLQILLPNNAVLLYSTLEILHYQLMIAEFFDHPLTVTYEHSPRGRAMNWLHDQYPDHIKGGKQPFLNIAKGLYRITTDWAFSRDQTQEALALTILLQRIESLGFPAKREIAEKLRWLIHRYIKGFQDTAAWVPEDLTSVAIHEAAAAVANAPSNTFGVLEQRLTDACCASLHPTNEGWHASAIGQSVFASNRSSKKFGDCEFIHHEDNRIVAYEAHAGRATKWYLEDHLSTLPETVRSRMDSLAEALDPAALQISIVFVAHQFAPPEDIELGGREIEGIRFEFATRTFRELLAEAEGAGAKDALRRHFALALNHSPTSKTMTPQRIRDRFLELAGSS